MTLGEFREQTKGMSDDLVLEFYSERYNDSTHPKYLEYEPEGYIEFIIDDNRWDLVDKKNTIIIPEETNENIKLLGEEHRKVREGITDEKVLIGYNMAIAICNKYLEENDYLDKKSESWRI